MPWGERIVCVGGGTGTFVVLSGLKKYCWPTAVVSMADNGGSTGRLRDEFGVLPPGDVRRALVALSSESKSRILRDLFSYRFSQPGSLHGHNFGNLLLTVLADILGGEDKAIAEAGRLLGIKGRVFPVTLEDTQLLAEYENGKQLLGERFIDNASSGGNGRIRRISLIPGAKIFDRAREALLAADLIILGPGDLFTSVVPNLLVTGVPEAICSSGAKLVYISNLMTKYGQTDGFSVSDHLRVVETHLDRGMDYVLVNKAPIPQEILEWYKAEKSLPVEDDLHDARVVRGDFLSSRLHRTPEGDVLTRGVLRHDSEKLAKALLSLC